MTSPEETGTASQLERRFEEIRALPKKDQQFALQVLDRILEIEGYTSGDDDTEDFVRIIKKMKEANEDREFKNWCSYLEDLPADHTRIPRDGFKADVELQPHRWLSEGVRLIESFKGSAHVQHMDGVEVEPMQKFLYYPVFQMGTEIFLKGMWLCQFEECRKLKHCGHIGGAYRKTN